MGVKRIIDILLSAMALILLSWLFLILCIAIKIDSRGPILFKQKRVGIHKTHFMIYKFRTMRIDTPKDMPTHMLADPEQYITAFSSSKGSFCPFSINALIRLCAASLEV